MNGGIQVCNTCNTSLAIGLKLHFCPYCGTVQLEKKVLASKTTQNYDPSNPQHKPWRDNPHLPKRNYTYGNSKKKQPWCPPMRQLRVRNRVGKSKNLLTGVGIDENLNFNSVDLHKVNQAVDNTDGDSYEGNVGEEHASQQAEKEAKSAPESFTEFYTEATWPLAVYDAEHWLAISGMTVNLSLIEQTLAVSCHNYWLRVGVTFEDIAAASPPSSPTGNNHEVGAGDEGDALYDAPIEAARGNATDSNVSASGFLRVDFPVAETSGQYLVSDDGVDAPIGGVEADQDGEVEAALALNNKASPDKEDENEKDEVGDQEEGMDRRAVESEKLYTLVVLSGDTARWMVPRMDDWVELSAVDPMEYYMARHMERILEAIAQRVVTTNLNELAMRRSYSVELRRKTKQSKLESTAEAVSGLPQEAIEKFVKNTTTTTASWGYNANQVVCTDLSVNSSSSSSSTSVAGALMSRTDSSLSVSFLDWVVQFSHLLVLTRGLSIHSYPALVRVSFRYGDLLDNPADFQAKTSSQRPATAASVVDLRSLAEKEAAAAALGDSKYIDPKVAERQRRFEVFAASQRVTHLVLTITPTAVSLDDEVVPPAELVFELACLKVLLLKHAPHSWDELLAEGKKTALLKAAKKLCSLVRLEYSDRGLQYSVIGSFTEPPYISCAWPHDAPEYLNEDLDDEDLLGEEEEGEQESAADLPINLPLPSPVRDGETFFMGVDAVSGAGWSDALSVEPSEPPTPVVLSHKNTSFTDEDVSEKVPLSPARWTCPFHPTQTPSSGSSSSCQCLRRQVTLKGSELWIVASTVPVSSARKQAEGSDDNSDLSNVIVPANITISECQLLPCAVNCANDMKIRAVDQTDESLHCDAVVPSAILSIILHAACPVRSIARVFNQREGEEESENDSKQSGVYYAISDKNTVDVDLLLHPALLEEVVGQLFSTAHVDLFLSRKSRLMKLVFK